MTNKELAECINKNSIATTKFLLGEITEEELKQAPDTRDNVSKINTLHKLLSDKINLEKRTESIQLQIEKEIGYDRNGIEYQELVKEHERLKHLLK